MTANQEWTDNKCIAIKLLNEILGQKWNNEEDCKEEELFVKIEFRSLVKLCVNNGSKRIVLLNHLPIFLRNLINQIMHVIIRHDKLIMELRVI